MILFLCCGTFRNTETKFRNTETVFHNSETEFRNTETEFRNTETEFRNTKIVCERRYTACDRQQNSFIKKKKHIKKMTFVSGNNNARVWKHFLYCKDLELAKFKNCSK